MMIIVTMHVIISSSLVRKRTAATHLYPTRLAKPRGHELLVQNAKSIVCVCMCVCVCVCVIVCVQAGKRWRRAKSTDDEESTLCFAVLALDPSLLFTHGSQKRFRLILATRDGLHRKLTR
jgi:hypothetical protein